MIEERGGRPILFPMIRVTEPDDWTGCDGVINHLEVYDCVVFTSVNAVQYFLARCGRRGISMDSLRGKTVVAVGSQTKLALDKENVTVQFVPDRHTSGALMQYFTREKVKGKKFLFPRGNLSRVDIVQHIEERGGTVDAVTVYHTSAPDRIDPGQIRKQFEDRTIDVVTFASPSAAVNFVSAIGEEYLARLKEVTTIAAIGPTTRKALSDLGMRPDIVADKPTVRSLVDAICAYFG
jgi:uroporphyrinogen-III synthase